MFARPLADGTPRAPASPLPPRVAPATAQLNGPRVNPAEAPQKAQSPAKPASSPKCSGQGQPPCHSGRTRLSAPHKKALSTNGTPSRPEASSLRPGMRLANTPSTGLLAVTTAQPVARAPRCPNQDFQPLPPCAAAVPALALAKAPENSHVRRKHSGPRVGPPGISAFCWQARSLEPTSPHSDSTRKIPWPGARPGGCQANSQTSKRSPSRPFEPPRRKLHTPKSGADRWPILLQIAVLFSGWRKGLALGKV